MKFSVSCLKPYTIIVRMLLVGGLGAGCGARGMSAHGVSELPSYSRACMSTSCGMVISSFGNTTSKARELQSEAMGKEAHKEEWEVEQVM